MPTPEAATWQRHRPENTVLYAIVQEHLPAFLRHADEHYATKLPKYVRRAFEGYLGCGLLERGFLRVHCDACRSDRLVAFSCKQRGPCPSCAARTMCNSAAHLTDRVLPNVPIRQWVLSLPFELRRLAARNPGVLAACSRIFVDAIFKWMRRTARLAQGRGGALTFVQRFGSSLNLHVHFHVLVLDGVFTRASAHEPPVFHPTRSPTPLDLQDVVRVVRDRVVAWLHRHGFARDDEAGGADENRSALDGCADEALQRGVFDQIGVGVAITRDDGDDALGHTTNRKSASIDGFNVHAAVRIGADDDVSREKLVRYCARPAFALERLSVLPDGRIAYAIKNPRRGASHRILTPIQLLARIAALIPPPYQPFLRYHGVLAPASKWRKDIVPRAIEFAPTTTHACGAEPTAPLPAEPRASGGPTQRP